MDEVIKERKDEYEVHIAKYFWNSFFILSFEGHENTSYTKLI